MIEKMIETVDVEFVQKKKKATPSEGQRRGEEKVRVYKAYPCWGSLQVWGWRGDSPVVATASLSREQMIELRDTLDDIIEGM